jgi:hypothetical protein
MLDLAERARRTEAVVAKYRTRAFSWRDRATCLHLARAQMRALDMRPPPMPDFRSPLSARKALKRAGHETVAGLLDSLLPRIAPLSMIVGDLAVLPGEDAFQAVVIHGGGTQMLGWHGEDLSQLWPIEVEVDDFVACYAVGR